MTVYVGKLLRCPASAGYRHRRSANLLADTEAELHAMAAQLGLNRDGCLRAPIVYYHLTTTYLVCEAIRLGAEPLGLIEEGKKIHQLRASTQPDKRNTPATSGSDILPSRLAAIDRASRPSGSGDLPSAGP